MQLSIIMPVYNGQKYLEESIKSILNQSYRDFEFIIIDDGSTDNSINIIKNYAKKDKRIRYISRENRGIVSTLNECIKLSKGKYIVRMDADDISNTNRIEKQYNYLKKNNLEIVFTNIEVIGDIKLYDKKTVENIHNNWDCSVERFMYGYLFCHPTAFIKKSIFNKIGMYDERYKYCEDLELWFRAYKNRIRIGKMDEKLLKYRKHKESKTYKDRFAYIEDYFKMRIEFVQDTIENNGLKIYVWGAGDSGKIALKILKEKNLIGLVEGFIDSYKVGSFLNKPIFSPEKILKKHNIYIFIATGGGRDFAIKYLLLNKYKYIDEFTNLI